MFCPFDDAYQIQLHTLVRRKQKKNCLLFIFCLKCRTDAIAFILKVHQMLMKQSNTVDTNTAPPTPPPCCSVGVNVLCACGALRPTDSQQGLVVADVLGGQRRTHADGEWRQR